MEPARACIPKMFQKNVQVPILVCHAKITCVNTMVSQCGFFNPENSVSVFHSRLKNGTRIQKVQLSFANTFVQASNTQRKHVCDRPYLR